MSMFGGIDAAASGLTAERLRMDVISIILQMLIPLVLLMEFHLSADMLFLSLENLKARTLQGYWRVR